jgi:hypothetical protein
MDRAVVIRMQRRAHERVAPYRQRRDRHLLDQLRDQAARWAGEQVTTLTGTAPDMPVEDRDADTWEPLVAIAEAAGRDWPARARRACLTLCGQAADLTLGERLLADLRGIFTSDDTLHTETLVAALVKLDESPWAEFRGKPLTPRGLAGLLKPYGVESGDVRIGETVRKGYQRADLADAWTRYLPQQDTSREAPECSATSATSATAQVSGHADVARSGYQTLHTAPS